MWRPIGNETLKRLSVYLIGLLFLLTSVFSVDAGGRRSYGTYNQKHYSGSQKTPGVPRDKKGRIKRSQSEKKKFLKSLGYKRVPSGYEVDHISPLYKGGADKAYNMRLIPKSQHKAKHHRR